MAKAATINPPTPEHPSPPGQIRGTWHDRDSITGFTRYTVCVRMKGIGGWTTTRRFRGTTFTFCRNAEIRKCPTLSGLGFERVGYSEPTVRLRNVQHVESR